MQYLVHGEFVDPGALLPPQQLGQIVENAVIPSLETLAKDKRVLAGGILAGTRVGVAILEAASNKEVDEFLQGLPFWGLLKWTVTPLTSYADRAAGDRKMIERLKAMK